MTRIQLASYSLIASAFILGGLLVIQLQGRVFQTAEADMVINRDHLTVMTAKTKEGEESMFVLDSISNQLLVYKLNVSKKRIELAAKQDLGRIFKSESTKKRSRGGSRRGR